MHEYIVPIIIAVIGSSGLWSMCVAIIQSKTQNKSAVNKALRGLLSDRLQHLCKKALKEGEIDLDTYQNIESLYRPYVALGGNGTIKHLKEQVDLLTIKED